MLWLPHASQARGVRGRILREFGNVGPTICYNTQPMPQHDVPSRGRVQADDGSGTFCEYAPKLTQRQKASEASSEAEVLWPSAQAAAQRTFGSCNVSINYPGTRAFEAYQGSGALGLVVLARSWSELRRL